MTTGYLKKILLTGAMGLALVLISHVDTSAQNRWETRQERVERERLERQRDRDRQRRLRNRRSGSQVSRQTEQRINNSTFATGYEMGHQAGIYDRRRGKYNQSNVYRNTGSYPNEGDPTSTDYIYRQGYLAGYNDGFNGRRNY